MKFMIIFMSWVLGWGVSDKTISDLRGRAQKMKIFPNCYENFPN